MCSNICLISSHEKQMILKKEWMLNFLQSYRIQSYKLNNNNMTDSELFGSSKIPTQNPLNPINLKVLSLNRIPVNNFSSM
jgi:hypothetical protein